MKKKLVISKKKDHYIIISIVLVLSTVLLFVINFAIFGREYNTLYYAFLSLCLVPFNTLIVSLVLDNLINYHSKKLKKNKLNMLISLFYIEIGNELLLLMSKGDIFLNKGLLKANKYNEIKAIMKKEGYCVAINNIDLIAIKDKIAGSQDILVSLICSEYISEHESFGDLLMAVLHLRDELLFRTKDGLTQDDLDHLILDVNRAYSLIGDNWFKYLNHLKNAYPYLYARAHSNNFVGEYIKL